MANLLRYFTLVLFVVTVTNSNVVYSQELYHFKSNGKIEVHGTSSIHDWHMALSDYQSNVKLSVSNDTIKILSSEVIAKTEDLSSDNSLMDKKAYSALKKNEFKTIEFNVVNPQVLVLNQTNSQKVDGVLYVAGVKKKVSFNSKLVKESASLILLKGELDLKMSDFNIEPPTAMLGTLKTGDDIKIIYELYIELVE